MLGFPSCPLNQNEGRAFQHCQPMPMSCLKEEPIPGSRWSCLQGTCFLLWLRSASYSGASYSGSFPGGSLRFQRSHGICLIFVVCTTGLSHRFFMPARKEHGGCVHCVYCTAGKGPLSVLHVLHVQAQHALGIQHSWQCSTAGHVKEGPVGP